MTSGDKIGAFSRRGRPHQLLLVGGEVALHRFPLQEDSAPALPKLPISLEALPPPESKRNDRMVLSFAPSEMAMVEFFAKERGEQPAVLCRTIVLTAFQNSAMRAQAERPELIERSPSEQIRMILESFSSE